MIGFYLNCYSKPSIILQIMAIFIYLNYFLKYDFITRLRWRRALRIFEQKQFFTQLSVLDYKQNYLPGKQEAMRAHLLPMQLCSRQSYFSSCSVHSGLESGSKTCRYLDYSMGYLSLHCLAFLSILYSQVIFLATRDHCLILSSSYRQTIILSSSGLKGLFSGIYKLLKYQYFMELGFFEFKFVEAAQFCLFEQQALVDENRNYFEKFEPNQQSYYQIQRKPTMWDKMMKLDLVKLKGMKSKEECSSSRIQNKKIGHFHSLDKQNLNPIQPSTKTQPSPQRSKNQRQSLQTQAEQPLLDQRSTRILYSASPHPEWSTKAALYKNELQSYKTRLYATEYQLKTLENQRNVMLEGQRMRYEKRIQELKVKLVDRDKQIREKDQMIKKFIVITRGL